MSGQEGAPTHRTQALWWTAGAVTVVSALFLVTGLAVPGFLRDENESSASPGESTAGASELPWAQQHPSLSELTPDEAVHELVATFVDRLNAGEAAGAVEMLCPGRRRLIRGSVVWTATHQAELRVPTLSEAARPGYVTVRFDGVIQGRERRGTIGLDADPQGRPSCVSTFFSVG
jgi:hypothetical protein